MIKKTNLIWVLLITAANTFGQTTNKSPYSFFGIGENSQQNTIASAGMGGVTVALQNSAALNFLNPALLHSLEFTVFDFGARTEFIKIQDATQNQQSGNTSLSYLSLGFPITEKLGFIAGLQPNTGVGYNLTEEIYDTDDELSQVSIFNGTGGTNRLFFGAGYELYKGLSVGLETEFLFGNIENTLIQQNAGIQNYSFYKTESRLTGNSWKLGLSYVKELEKDLSVTAESSFTLANDIKTKNDEYLYSFFYNQYGVVVPQDTLVSNTELSAKIKRPLHFHSGLGIGKDDFWYAGVSYNRQNAWEFGSVILNNDKVSYTPRSTFSLGGYFLPKKNSITSYWNRVVYRAGLKFEKPGISVRSSESIEKFTELTDFGISFGLGLPIGNQLSKINMSMEIGKRGTTADGLIQENYVNLRLGLNIAEKWFQKSKIN